MKSNKVIEFQKSRFVLIGAINTLFALLLFSVLVSWSNPEIQVIYLNIISSSISYVTGYFLYKNFVWTKTRASLVEFYRFVKSNILFLGLNIISLQIFVNGLDLSPITVQVTTTGVLVVISFLIHDNWTFDQRSEELEFENSARVRDEE